MADAKSNTSTDTQPASQKGGQWENIRNLSIILGITILLIVAVILIAFFIAGIANNGKPTGSVTPSAVTNTDQTNPPSGTNGGTNTDTTPTDDTILGSLGGGIADTKPENSTTEPAPVPPVFEIPEAVVSPPQNPLKPKVPESYTFTAGEGDSVSWLARRAMYAFMGDRGVGLDVGQRLYFETTLMQQSNPAVLNVGESRTFSSETMQQIFSAATQLSGSELSAWTNLAVQSGYV